MIEFRNSIPLSKLPNFIDILRSFFLHKFNERKIVDIWLKGDEIPYWFSKSAWSLRAIASFRIRLHKTSKINIWLPSYFCNETLIPLRDLGTNLFFYQLDSENNPILPNQAFIDSTNKPDLFIAVHYFGQPANLIESVSFCKKWNTWLIEDAAHVLKAVPGVGDFGDFIIYSPHKHLAIPDGALMLFRGGGPSQIDTGECNLALFSEVLADLAKNEGNSSSEAYIWILKRVLQLIGFRKINRKSDFLIKRPSFEQVSQNPRMSIIGKRLIPFELKRIDELEKIREEITIKWNVILKYFFNFSNFELSLSRFSRYLACFRFANKFEAEKAYMELFKSELPVLTWPNLPQEVLDDSTSHNSAIEERLTRIFLPIHENVNDGFDYLFRKNVINLNLNEWSLEEISSSEIWCKYWNKVEKQNLTQSWEYGEAKSQSEGWGVLRFLILKNNIPCGIMQVLTRKIPLLGLLIARVNRGPLLINSLGYSNEVISVNIINALNHEAIKRKWFMMQIAPELPLDHSVETALQLIGFHKRDNCPADSGLFSLREDESQLLMRLDGKWRNTLRKGQKFNLKIVIDNGAYQYFDLLLNYYKKQQAEKGFEGTSEKMLRALASNQNNSFRLKLFLAFENDIVSEISLHGILVTINYGDTSEYLIGITNSKGRNSQANSVLLWEAILDAKHNGYTRFDLGGLAKNTPEGIAKFKRGLNANLYSLSGEWRKWFF
ncbi:peptidoglycan bridge formation glycyltransferase FemA/FemB family protein [Leptospira levettii]|uniref:lipid II:glycine glycyltransferase FemX n=1 Tax=Leptospira levettii TaxID=2023178 RepID=UPI00223CE1FA|nr:peptidoglycan bridge formation glycyltransferase FemA/FemB family protein [Leptospira levettii]MCW7497037.1 peptidoglycan bridge formation glycyltransferase FemA/FemB family protein [Leptospira levettii]